MAIAYRSVSTLASGTRTSSTVPMPAGVVAGDEVRIVLGAGRAGSSAPAITPTTSGVTLVASVDYGTGSEWWVRLSTYRYRVAGSGDPSGFVFTTASATTDGWAVAFSGVDSTTPDDASPTSVAGSYTSAQSVPIPSLTTVTADTMLVATRGSWDGLAITPPAGWTEDGDQAVTWIGHMARPATGATGTVSIPSGQSSAGGISSPSAGVLMALRPASGAEQITRTATGSLTLAGTAAVVEREVATAAGALTLAGTAPAAAATTAAAEIVLSGTAIVAGGQHTRTATGTLTLTGIAPDAIATTATDGPGLSGDGEVAGGSPERDATGAVALTGSATAAARHILTAAGTLTLTGSAPQAVQYVKAATGTLTLLGTADAEVAGETPVRTATGTLVLTGTATATVREIRTADGTISLTGTALTLTRHQRTATGTLVLGGIGTIPSTAPSLPDRGDLTITIPTGRLTLTTPSRTLTITTPAGRLEVT